MNGTNFQSPESKTTASNFRIYYAVKEACPRSAQDNKKRQYPASANCSDNGNDKGIKDVVNEFAELSDASPKLCYNQTMMTPSITAKYSSVNKVRSSASKSRSGSRVSRSLKQFQKLISDHYKQENIIKNHK